MSVITGVEGKTEAAKKLALANRGYMRMNIADPPCGVGAWGKFNSRKVEDKGVQKLRVEFRPSGPLNCDPEKVIYLPVRDTWYQGTPLEAISGRYIRDVPELVLTDAGRKAIADKEFWPLNGNHRRAAVVLHVDDLTQDLEALQKARTGLTGADLEAKDEEIAKMEARLQFAPFWTVQLFDIGVYFCDYSLLML